MVRRTAIAAALAAAFGACGEGEEDSGVDLTQPIALDLSQPMPEKLSSLNLFAWDPATAQFTFHDGIVPYDLNTPLFSDYALKQRAIYVPSDAGAAPYNADHVLDFPVGTAIIKSFAFPADLRSPDQDVSLIETRLLVHYDNGWQAFPYIWDDEAKDATLSPAGEVRSISFIDREGEPLTANYLVPQKNQCGNCHLRKPDVASAPEMTLLGPSARQLHREGQLEALATAGFISDMPAVDTIPTAYDFRVVEAGGVAAVAPEDLDRAARDYLDANCAHCHNPNGVQGVTSQLFLNYANTDPFHLGICKQPGSAGLGSGGLKYDIVPQHSAKSVLSFRMTSTDPGAMMPLLGRSVAHARGIELIDAWITAMPATEPAACGLP